MAFDIESSIVRRLELPLHQKVTVVAVLGVGKQNLEILTARYGD
jgi:hypothetical protein